MKQTILFVTLAMTWALLAALPRLSRPDIFFGVTVDPEFRNSEAGRRILRGYDLLLFLSMLAALALGLLLPNGVFSGVAGGMTGLVTLLSFVVSNRRTKPYARPASPIREASLELRDDSLPGGLLAFLGPLGILLASGVYIWRNWEQMPARIPTHFGINGTADRWMTKGPWAIAGFLLTGAAICVVMTIAGAGISRSRRIALRGEAVVNETRFRNVNLILLLLVDYAMALLFAGIPVLAIAGGLEAVRTTAVAVSIFTVVISLLVVIVSLRFGQGGTRLAGSHVTGAGDRTPDECWRWGMLYVNRADPSIFVEKRFGLGYTVNFGNPSSWYLLGGTFAVVVLSAILTR